MPGDPDGHSTEALAARVTTLERTVADLERRLTNLASDSPDATPLPALPPAQPAPHRSVPGPSIGQRLAEEAHRFDLETLIAGRWLNRVGLLAVAIGVAYFLKLAIDSDWIGPGGQVALGLLLGAALLASTPWFLKRGHVYFADGISGLGAAVLYLALWAAGDYYHLISLGLTFGLMALVTGSMIAMAVARSSQSVAVIALLGGFASPALLSTGTDAEITLFAYLALLNAALLPLAWSRNWRGIDITAFALTELYFWGWYGSFYTPEKLLPTAAFATLFFAMFLALPLLSARRTGRLPPEHRVLVPSNAFVVLVAAIAMLWPDQQWTLTVAMLLLSAAHVLFARTVPTTHSTSDARLLFGGVALTIATLVIPVRLDGSWITLAWSIEGAVLVWIGFRTGSRSMRGMAFLLLAFAVLRVANMTTFLGFPPSYVVLNPRFLTAAITIACLAIAVRISGPHLPALTSAERSAFAVLAVIVNILAVLVLTAEVRMYFRPFRQPANALAEGLVISLLWALYAGGLMVFGVRHAIAGLRWQALALFGLTTWKVLINDMASLNGFYRVASSTALGLVLLIVSFVYQRSLRDSRPIKA